MVSSGERPEVARSPSFTAMSSTNAGPVNEVNGVNTPKPPSKKTEESGLFAVVEALRREAHPGGWVRP